MPAFFSPPQEVQQQTHKAAVLDKQSADFPLREAGLRFLELFENVPRQMEVAGRIGFHSSQCSAVGDKVFMVELSRAVMRCWPLVLVWGPTQPAGSPLAIRPDVMRPEALAHTRPDQTECLLLGLTHNH